MREKEQSYDTELRTYTCVISKSEYQQHSIEQVI